MKDENELFKEKAGRKFRLVSLNSAAFVYLMIVVGTVLRLVWTGDMEWKEDEKDMYRMAQEAVQKAALPAAGMRSGGGIVNPGLSVAPFAFFALFTNNPMDMNRMVQVVNILALLCFLFFVNYKIKSPDREVWLSGLALAAVSPLAVLFSRKIWAQDILPLISFLIIFANYYRHKKWGAFVWGLAGALIGQFHMSGFFFAGGIFLFTVIHDHFNGRKFLWGYWLLGSALGSITIITWLLFMFQHPQSSKQSLLHILQFNFFLYWFIDALGLNIYYSLRGDFSEYIKGPILFGIPTYFALLVHLFLAFIAALTLKKLFLLCKFLIQKLRAGIALKTFFQQMSPTRFYLLSIFLGLAVIMTLSSVEIHPHYLICAIPFQYIFLAKLFENQQMLFRWIVLAQLFISFSFLVFIHTNRGAPNGDYGVAYTTQMNKAKD